MAFTYIITKFKLSVAQLSGRVRKVNAIYEKKERNEPRNAEQSVEAEHTKSI